MAIEAETLNGLILRRLLPQTVLDVFPQIMWQKLSLILEEKYKGSANLLGSKHFTKGQQKS